MFGQQVVPGPFQRFNPLAPGIGLRHDTVIAAHDRICPLSWDPFQPDIQPTDPLPSGTQARILL